MREPLLLCVRRRATPWLAVAAIAFGAALTFAPAPPASAAWSLSGSGSASGAATTMPTGAAPRGTAGTSSVTLSWSAVTLADGAAVGGYIINRYNSGTGALQTVNAACSGTITTTTCTEQSLPAGTWVYTDTPVLNNWTGGASPDSAPVTTSS